MASLLLQLHLARTDDPQVPLVDGISWAWTEFWVLALRLGVRLGVGQSASSKEL